MSTLVTKKMLEYYEQIINPSLGFFTGMFQAPRGNYHTSEEVEIDIVRSGRDIAVAIHDVGAGYRLVSNDEFTNKKFKPPVFKEGFVVTALESRNRQPGDIEYLQPEIQRNGMKTFMKRAEKAEIRIKGANELQCAQVMQNGVADLKDEYGNTVYTIDYKPKATHMQTAAVPWNNPAATIMDDLQELIEPIILDYGVPPEQLIFGAKAWSTAIQNTAFKDNFETRRIDTGRISPLTSVGNGGQFRGVVDIANYQCELWTVEGYYTDPKTKIDTRYLDEANVIARVGSARLDGTFGNIPLFRKPGGAALPFLPRRASRSGERSDMIWNSWVTEDSSAIMGWVGSRPLFIPTAIDSFARLATGV